MVSTRRLGLAVAMSLLLIVSGVSASRAEPVPDTAGSTSIRQPLPAKAHHKVQRRMAWHGYGYLPGYRSPARIEWERAQNARSQGPVFWYGYPRFYRGRWNGGGFGPCWTQTPIGPHWNCG